MSEDDQDSKPNDHARLRELFLRILEMDSEQRADALRDLAPEIRKEVETMLAHNDSPEGWLGQVWSDDSTSTASSPGIPHLRLIGPYKILQKIGEGGMGEVYLAEQQDPRRTVALKIIKWGMDTKQVIARFEAERQALALMDHPNIAKVFDAGATEQGRPYFVMEHVKGVPITKFCDKNRLTTRERMALFVQVCEGIHHAHQNAIIHRDIKPSNVLVATPDGKRVPKIIDFGVAKATAQRLTERTVFTELGQLIGTPEYMSPEQAEMTAEDVDTRTDVYSLGVLLYELLVGDLPFDSAELRRAGFDEVRRKIREDEPPRPSTRISTMGDAATGVAIDRGSDIGSLQRELRGDLDWITMKCLEKDRTRRYDSPSELAADILRHLENRPVVASPPSSVYRAQKFMRRHRIGVSAIAVALVSMLAVMVVLSVQAHRIARERDRANEEAAIAKEVVNLMISMAESSDPRREWREHMSPSEHWDRAAMQILGGQTLADQPILRAQLLDTIAWFFRSVGRQRYAEGLLREALVIRREQLGGDDPETLQTMYRLSVVLQNQNLFDEAEGLLRQVLSTQRRLQEVDSLDTLTTMGDLATLYDRQGRYDRAAELWNEIYSATNQLATEGTLDPGYPEQRGRAMGRLTDLYERMGRYEKVEELLLEGLRGWLEAYGEDYPAVHGIKYRLARMAALQGNRSRSLDLLQELEGQYSVLRDVRVDVAFESLHGDPRFDAIVLALDKLEQPDVDSGNRK